MTFKGFFNFLRGTYLVLLMVGTATILMRRMMWDQIPTQISPWVVYLTLAINCGCVVVLLRRWRRTT